MKGYRPEQVMNGTHAEVWIDDEYMAEATGLNAKVSLNKAEVKMLNRMTKGYKVIGYEGKGELNLNKVSSYMIKKLSDNMKAGRQTVCTIVSKLKDPDAIGEERIVIKDAVFDELTLIDWEAQKNGEEKIPFTFSNWDVINLAL